MQLPGVKAFVMLCMPVRKGAGCIPVGVGSWWPRLLDKMPSPCLLQEWVTVTDLLISLNRLNTFGDDIFKDPKVLQSYYYAISDFSVGGR